MRYLGSGGSYPSLKKVGKIAWCSAVHDIPSCLIQFSLSLEGKPVFIYFSSCCCFSISFAFVLKGAGIEQD